MLAIEHLRKEDMVEGRRLKERGHTRFQRVGSSLSSDLSGATTRGSFKQKIKAVLVEYFACIAKSRDESASIWPLSLGRVSCVSVVIWRGLNEAELELHTCTLWGGQNNLDMGHS